MVLVNLTLTELCTERGVDENHYHGAVYKLALYCPLRAQPEVTPKR